MRRATAAGDHQYSGGKDLPMLSVATDNEWAETLIALVGDNAGNAARHFGKENYDRGMVAHTIVWSPIAYAIDQRRCQSQKGDAVVASAPAIANRLASATYDSVLFADLHFASLELAGQPQAAVSLFVQNQFDSVDTSGAKVAGSPIRLGEP